MPSHSIRHKYQSQDHHVEPARFYRLLVETIPHMVWTARPDGSLDYFNSHVLAYTGRSMRQLEGWGWRSVIHPEYWERCLKTWTRALKSGKPNEIEFQLKRYDGKYRWHLGAALPLRHGGRIVRWIGTCTDIDDQKRASRLLEQARQTLETLVATKAHALEENEQRMRVFLDSMPAVAWIKDDSFRYAWISGSWRRNYGISPGDARGRDDFDIYPEDLARHFRRDDEKALRVNGPVQSVDSVPDADGTMSRWLVVKFPLPDESGALGVAGIAFKITTPEPGEPQTGGRSAVDSLERLSARERQVLRLIVDGYTSLAVAEQLDLSPKSVDTYRSRLMAKLEIENLPALVKFAIRHGLTTIS